MNPVFGLIIPTGVMLALLIDHFAWPGSGTEFANYMAGKRRLLVRALSMLLGLVIGILLATGAFFWAFAGYAAMFGTVTMTWGAV